MKSLKGYTLVELLIAMAVVSSLMLVGSFSYQFFANRWNKELGSFSKVESLSSGLIALQSIFKGISPFVIYNTSTSPRTPTILFEGNNDALLGYTKRGLMYEEEIFRILIEPEGEGFQLVYQYNNFNKMRLLETTDTIEFEKSVVLLSNIKHVTFQYYGWNSITEKVESGSTGTTPNLMEKYSSSTTQLLPLYILVSIVTEEGSAVIKVDTEKGAHRHISPYIGRLLDEV